MEPIKALAPTETVGYKNPPRGWKPGQSGNPGGLPKGTPKVSVALMKLLRTSPAEKFVRHNKADEIALALYERALGGDVSAITVILDRTEGRVTQTLNIGAAALPTNELVERLVQAFSECGVEELAARRVLLSLGSGDGDDY